MSAGNYSTYRRKISLQHYLIFTDSTLISEGYKGLKISRSLLKNLKDYQDFRSATQKGVTVCFNRPHVTSESLFLLSHLLLTLICSYLSKQVQ